MSSRCKKPKKISVIIPAYDEENYLPATLEKIRAALANANFEAETIVVDNESTDKTRLIAENFGAKVFTETEHNTAKVRNTGAKNAKGDILVFIDADTIVPETLFQKIADAMRDEKYFGGAVAVDYVEFKRKWMKFYLRGWQFWGTIFNMKHGAAQFCHKSMFEQSKGYDETVFMGEDVMFYRRLSKFARRENVSLFFIENPMFFLPTSKKRRFWRDWYENAVR